MELRVMLPGNRTLQRLDRAMADRRGISTTACVLEGLLGIVKGLWLKIEKTKMQRRAGED